jgi:curved DNA-binding protein CbpA
MNIAQALSELDLRPGATEQEIRSAYRTLVAKWHPDKHQNDPIRLREAELRIKNINRAFETLQRAGFRTEKPSGKGGQKTEKPKGRSQSKSPEPPEVPKDGASEQKAQKQPDDKPVKGRREKLRWPIELFVGAVVLFLAGFLLGRSLDSGDQNLRQVVEGRQGVDGLEQQLLSKETELKQPQEALQNTKNVSDERLRDLEQVKKDKKELNDDRNKLAKENTAMHEKIVNLELTVSELKKSELEETGHQEKLAYARAFIREAAEEDRKKTLIDLLMPLKDDERLAVIGKLIPPADNDLSQKIAETYFKEVDSDKQNKVLKECYADYFGFTASGIEKELQGRGWRFYWDGLSQRPPRNPPPPEGTLWLQERDQAVSRKARPDGTWKVTDVTRTDEQRDAKKKIEGGVGWQLCLRWVLQEGRVHQHFPVADLDVVGGNPFGADPQFRGWYLLKRGVDVYVDRAIGLKPD